MLSARQNIRFHLAAILGAAWWDFVRSYGKWIRPVVFDNVRKVLACRTAVLGCHVYRCADCGHVKLVPHSCKRAALNQPEPTAPRPPSTWAERQKEHTHADPLICPRCDKPLVLFATIFGRWDRIEELFARAGVSRPISPALLQPP